MMSGTWGLARTSRYTFSTNIPSGRESPVFKKHRSELTKLERAAAIAHAALNQEAAANPLTIKPKPVTGKQ
jgi:hypothetical protein